MALIPAAEHDCLRRPLVTRLSRLWDAVLLALVFCGAWACGAQTIVIHPGGGPSPINGPWTVAMEGAHGSRQMDGVWLNEPLRGLGPVRVM